MMKVLLLNGSPRKNGCTYTALEEVAAALNENGIETEFVHIGNKPLRGCIACNSCEDGVCQFDSEDEVVKTLKEKMKECDGFIVGSPVYYASPNGTVLSVLDRAFYSGAEYFKGKPGAAVVSARRAGTTASLDVLNKYFTITGMPIVPSQYWCMVHGNTPEEVKQDKEGLQIMRTLARSMAWMLKSIEAGKNCGIEPPAPEAERQRTNFIR